jgi:ubiquinone/menaquinone biosynthesis C-methylase UbiE
MTTTSHFIEPARRSSQYFMDDPREAQRLADKVDPIEWVNRYVARHVRPDSRVLDVGSGPGVLATEVARRCLRGQVVALDQSVERSSQAGMRLARYGGYSLVGDAAILPFEDGSFDLVYCRFLLEYLRDPEQAVREMVRVCRPGGRVLLQDLDGQLLWHYPEDAELERQVTATLAILARTGFDPFAGRKLYHHAYSMGLTQLCSNVEVYHHYAGSIDTENGRLWNLKLDIALPAAAVALGSEREAQALKTRFLNYLRRPDTFTYSNLVTVVGVRPE